MKSMKYVLLGTLALGLVACGSLTKNEGNKVVTQKAMNSLAYQATTSLAVMSDLGNMTVAYNVSSPRALMSKVDKTIDEAKKAQIESLLPTVDLLMKNNNSFKSEVLTSDRAEYNHKQVVSFFDINEENTSYTLYYNLGSDALTEEDKITSSSEALEPSVKMAKDEKEEDKSEDVEDEEEDKEDNEVETATTFEGIAVVGEDEFSFTARSTEEIEDQETEKEFELRINNGEGNYIEVVHEIETEDLEVEEEYRYTVVQGNEIVHEFEFEQERETEDNKEENKIKLVINNEKFSFKFYEEQGEEFIRVKYDNKSEDKGKIVYKKVVSTLEDGTESVTFEEVK